MVTDFNETVGDKGDIVLADWGMYRTITKSGGLETAPACTSGSTAASPRSAPSSHRWPAQHRGAGHA